MARSQCETPLVMFHLILGYLAFIYAMGINVNLWEIVICLVCIISGHGALTSGERPLEMYFTLQTWTH
jgi:hypothetical protein